MAGGWQDKHEIDAVSLTELNWLSHWPPEGDGAAQITVWRTVW